MNNDNVLNFVDPILLPKVFTNSPASDHYEAENLISDESAQRRRGFIAYSSIKPPVELEFQFICNANINYVEINTTNGTQKCTGVELYAKISEDAPYVLLSKAIYDKQGIIFYNKRKFVNETDYSKDYHICFFRNDTYKIFLNALFIKVLIFRTEKSVPCISYIKVCGTLARTCSTTTKETIKKIIGKNNVDSIPDSDGSSNKSIPESETEELVIPEDFKDSLTYEVMTIPMTLPSGKTIDRSTLEKHLEIESNFKRKPCDPFTGIKFTENCKPVLNAALKSRIDMFLIQNSHRSETFHLKRTLGKTNGFYISAYGRQDEVKRKTENNDEPSKRFRHKLGCQDCTSSENLYKIPCSHIYCRLCVVKITEKLKCSICDESFLKSEIEKYHI